MSVEYSNLGTTGAGTVQLIQPARFFNQGGVSTAEAAAIFVRLAAMEVQVLVPTG